MLSFGLVGMMLMGTSAVADIYKCVSDDGVISFSDRPCGNDAEIIIKQSLPSVDDAVGVEIEPYLKPYTSKTYGEYITNQAKRISRSILPGQWFIASELIRVYGPSPRGSHSFPKPKPIYGTTPGWVIILFYGPESNVKKWELKFQFVSLVRKDIDGIARSVVFLKSISIKNNGEPFTPPTMHHVKNLKRIGTGKWEVRHQ